MFQKKLIFLMVLLCIAPSACAASAASSKVGKTAKVKAADLYSFLQKEKSCSLIGHGEKYDWVCTYIGAGEVQEGGVPSREFFVLGIKKPGGFTFPQKECWSAETKGALRTSEDQPNTPVPWQQKPQQDKLGYYRGTITTLVESAPHSSGGLKNKYRIDDVIFFGTDDKPRLIAKTEKFTYKESISASDSDSVSVDILDECKMEHVCFKKN